MPKSNRIISIVLAILVVTSIALAVHLWVNNQVASSVLG